MFGQTARVQAITSALEDAREKEKEKNKDNSTMGGRMKRERPFIQSHKIRPQKIDFEYF